MSKREEKGLVPELRFSEFRDEGDWERKLLNSICDVLNNMRQPVMSNNRERGRYPYYGASGIVDYVNSYIFDERLLLVGEDGAKWGAFENTAFIVEGKYWVNNHAHVLRPQKIKDTLLENYLVKLDIGPLITGAAPPKLTLQSLKSIPVPVPRNKKEQQKIADCLSSIDENITAQTEKLEALKNHKKGLMQQLFPSPGGVSASADGVVATKPETTPKLRFPEFRDGGDWVLREVGNIYDVTRGNVLPMNVVNEKYSEEAPYPVYSSQTKNNGLAGYYNEYLYEDAITWTTDGANAGDVNYRAGKFYCTNVCGVLLNKKGFANLCIAELLNTVTRRHVSYVGNPKIMNGVMSKISIPFPEPKEQQKIAACLSSIDDLITIQTKKLDALKNHKKGLMQQLFPSFGGVAGEA